MEALRDLADDFNVRGPRKLYRLARQRDLDVTQAMAFEALKADVGRQVQAKYGLVVMDVFTREAAVLCRTRTPRRRAAPPSAPRRELCGRDRPGQRVRHAGPGLPAEAVRRTKRFEDRNAIAVVDRGIQTLKKDLATRVARKGGQWSDHFERAAGAYNARPHETAHGAPEDVEKQPATEFRVLQDNADKFQHNKDLRGSGGSSTRIK